MLEELSIEEALQSKDETTKDKDFFILRAGQGRPKKSQSEKKKGTMIYLSDSQKESIEKCAAINGMKLKDFIKFCINKELRKENINISL